jgi:16S rRNA (guanine966-N2)-methyltransferase
VLVFSGISAAADRRKRKGPGGYRVRIISGSARGKRLVSFSGKDIRPTPDRVRESIFNILFSKTGTFSGKTVLDLFAGTGAMAIEALSRGARRACLVDQGQQAARVIPANLKNCDFQDRAFYIRSDFEKALLRLEEAGPFDVVFLDPPYGRGLVAEALSLIAKADLLAPGGMVCAETSALEEVPESVGGLELLESRRYGSTAVHFYAFSDQET